MVEEAMTDKLEAVLEAARAMAAEVDRMRGIGATIPLDIKLAGSVLEEALAAYDASRTGWVIRWTFEVNGYDDGEGYSVPKSEARAWPTKEDAKSHVENYPGGYGVGEGYEVVRV
jgi:hypothetical protein